MSALLLTGSTGFVGGELLLRWLERTDREVVTLVRAADDDAAAERVRKTLGELAGDPGAHADRIQAVAADLSDPGLGLPEDRAAELAERVDTIVHCAASVSFDLDLPEARAINVAGTEGMLDLARRCPGLRRYAHVSTAYVAGDRGGTASEDELDPSARFRNPYERSKAEAEALVREAASELPVQVFRPSIVVGDSRTGWTSSFNVLYGPMRAFALGAYPLIPARRSAPVDVVPVNYVADSIFALVEEDGGEGETFHLVAGERASSVGELIELGSDLMDKPPPRVVPPVAWRLIRPVLRRRLSGRARLVLERSEVYFPYFTTRIRYDDRRARSHLEPHGIQAPELRDYFPRLVEFAREARWGKRPVARAARSPRGLRGAPA